MYWNRFAPLSPQYDLEGAGADVTHDEDFFQESEFTSNHRSEENMVGNVLLEQPTESSDHGCGKHDPIIVYPVDSTGQSLHRYFVKGHWEICINTMTVLRWFKPDPLSVQYEAHPVQERDSSGNLVNRAIHLAWIKRQTSTNYTTLWKRAVHPLKCVQDWIDGHSDVRLVAARINLDLPSYVFNPWEAYDVKEWEDLGMS